MTTAVYHIERMHYQDGVLCLSESDNVVHLNPATAVKEVAKEMCLVRDTSEGDLDGTFVEHPGPTWYAKIWDIDSGDPIIEWIIVPTVH